MPGVPHVCHVAADDRNGKAGRLNSSTATSPPYQQLSPIAGGHGTRRKPAAMAGATRERPRRRRIGFQLDDDDDVRAHGRARMEPSMVCSGVAEGGGGVASPQLSYYLTSGSKAREGAVQCVSRRGGEGEEMAWSPALHGYAAVSGPVVTSAAVCVCAREFM